MTSINPNDPTAAIVLLTQPEEAEKILNAIPAIPDLLNQRKVTIQKAGTYLRSVINNAKIAFDNFRKDPSEDNANALIAHDTALNGELVRCSQRLREWKEIRTPVTKFWTDNVVTPLTTSEKFFNKDEYGSLPAEMQKIRNEVATYFKDVEAKKLAAQKLEQDKINERINLSSGCEIEFARVSGEYQLNKLQMLQAMLDSLTLQNFVDFPDRVALPIKNFPESPAETKDFSFSYNPRILYITPDEGKDIITRTTNTCKITFGRTFRQAIIEKKAELIDKIPGKKMELQEAEDARKETIRLQKLAAEQKDTLVKARMLKDAEEAKAKEEKQKKATEERQAQEKKDAEILAENKRMAEEKAAINRGAAASAQASFDLAADSAATELKTVGSVKDKVTIEVTQPAGWMLILNHFFTHEAKDFTMDELEKKFGFARKLAEKSEHKIESPLIKYGKEIVSQAKK